MKSRLVTLLAVAIAAVAVIFTGARLLSAPTRPPAVHARLPASPPRKVKASCTLTPWLR